MCTPWLSPNSAWLEWAPTRSGNMEQRALRSHCWLRRSTHTNKLCVNIELSACTYASWSDSRRNLGVRCSVRKWTELWNLIPPSPAHGKYKIHTTQNLNALSHTLSQRSKRLTEFNILWKDSWLLASPSQYAEWKLFIRSNIWRQKRRLNFAAKN